MSAGSVATADVMEVFGWAIVVNTSMESLALTTSGHRRSEIFSDNASLSHSLTLWSCLVLSGCNL